MAKRSRRQGKVAHGKAVVSALLDALKSAKPRSAACWFDKLPADAQVELSQVREAWHAGELSHLSASDVWRQCTKAVGATIGRACFCNWLAMESES